MPDTPSTNPKAIKPKRRRGGLFNFLLIIAIIAAIGAFAWAEQQRRDTETRLEQTKKELEEVRKISQQQGQQVTEEVLSKVRQHFDLPQEPQPTVATIIDIDALRDTNPFYQKAKNGDHLIITENRAILFAPDRDIILDVVPVQIEQATPSPDADGQSAAPAATPANSSPSPAPAETPATATPTAQP